MKIDILTMYPSIFDGFCKNPIVSRAIESGACSFSVYDMKSYTEGCYRKLDDSPYGGGKGMILRCDAVDNALSAVRDENSHVVLLSPKGRVFDQSKAVELSGYQSLLFVCGHYEGYDKRIESYCDEMISVGDYILSGGENAACVICDSVIRLLPGVLKDGVVEDESFSNGLLEYDQYTHPSEYKGMSVPKVLLSGNRAEIEKFRRESALHETALHRPDLLEKPGVIECSADEQKY